MMIDIPRLRGSAFDATLDDGAWRAGLNLWLTAWHQVPAASLPDDDASLAKHAGLGRDIRTWRKVKAEALRGWVPCDDGLLYHPVVAEMALEAWLEKRFQALSSGAGNAKRWGSTFDPTPIEEEIELCAGMLAALNPTSKALSKLQRRKSRPSSDGSPTGTGNASHRDAKAVPVGSQGTGTGKDKSSVSNETGDEPPDRVLVELSELDPKAAAWRLARMVLIERGGLKAKAAGDLIGKWVNTEGLNVEQLWAIAETTWRNGTDDPVPYMSAAVRDTLRQAVGLSGVVAPTEARQRSWMEEFVVGGDWRVGDRGPRPGESGCRIVASIQREFGVDPAPPALRKEAVA